MTPHEQYLLQVAEQPAYDERQMLMPFMDEVKQPPRVIYDDVYQRHVDLTRIRREAVEEFKYALAKARENRAEAIQASVRSNQYRNFTRHLDKRGKIVRVTRKVDPGYIESPDEDF